MGFRFRKSIKLAKGVRLNLGKRGVGMSVGIPGTGLSYSTSSGGRKRGSKRSAGTTYVVKKPMKTGLVPMLLTIFLGMSGAHWFFSGRIGMGFLYLFTFGLFGVGWLVDVIRQVVAFVKLVKKVKKEEQKGQE